MNSIFSLLNKWNWLPEILWNKFGNNVKLPPPRNDCRSMEDNSGVCRSNCKQFSVNMWNIDHVRSLDVTKDKFNTTCGVSNYRVFLWESKYTWYIIRVNAYLLLFVWIKRTHVRNNHMAWVLIWMYQYFYLSTRLSVKCATC